MLPYQLIILKPYQWGITKSLPRRNKPQTYHKTIIDPPQERTQRYLKPRENHKNEDRKAIQKPSKTPQNTISKTDHPPTTATQRPHTQAGPCGGCIGHSHRRCWAHYDQGSATCGAQGASNGLGWKSSSWKWGERQRISWKMGPRGLEAEEVKSKENDSKDSPKAIKSEGLKGLKEITSPLRAQCCHRPQASSPDRVCTNPWPTNLWDGLVDGSPDFSWWFLVILVVLWSVLFV